MSHPHLFRNFSLWMEFQRQGQPSWLETFPIERLTQNPDSPMPLLVDVGGGVGHQCVELKRKLPLLSRRIVVEDLAPVIALATRFDGVEYLAHDFWTPQPILGASFYYMRNVLHDYPDNRCIELLRLQRPAMRPESVLLIDEVIVPNERASVYATTMDIGMMAIAASMERTESQWRALLNAAGLTIKELYVYEKNHGHHIIVAGLL